MSDFLAELEALLGPKGVIAGEEARGRSSDWTGQRPCEALAIARPADTAETAALMKLCHRRGRPVTVAGGLTGVVRGAEAAPEELLVSFERMTAIEALDPVGRTLTAQAGVPLQKAQEAAREAGLLYPVDLGGRGSATIGGTIATNAGGNQVIRYGMTRANVLGLEAVLADGTVLSAMNTLLKNNAAYDLKQLFIGSEGTLGLVTRAVLRLQPAPGSQNTALVALKDFAALTAFFGEISARLGGDLTAFEVMWRDHYALMAVETGRHTAPLPADHAYYAIVEAWGVDPDRDAPAFRAALEGALEQGLLEDAVIASSQAQAAAIWAIREDVEGLFKTLAPLAAFDVSLPITEMEAYVEALKAAAAAEWSGRARILVFGHLGDGNLHILAAPRPWDEAARERVEALVYRPLQAIGGSISAEHGIGLEKRAWLSVSRSPQEIALMKALKATLDPAGLLNRRMVFAEDSARPAAEAGEASATT